MIRQNKRRNEKMYCMQSAGSKDIFYNCEAAIVCVQTNSSSNRDDKLLRNVSNHGSEVGWNSQGYNVLVHDLVNGERSISASWLTVRTLPKNEAFYFPERAIEFECTHHPIDAVRVFSHIFNTIYRIPVLEIHSKKSQSIWHHQRRSFDTSA